MKDSFQSLIEEMLKSSRNIFCVDRSPADHVVRSYQIYCFIPSPRHVTGDTSSKTLQIMKIMKWK